MEKLKNYLVWFTLLGGALPSLRAESAAASKAGVAPKPADTKASGDAKTSAPATLTKEQQNERIETLGCIYGFNLNIGAFGFTPEQKAIFVKGVTAAVNGEVQPPSEEKAAASEAFIAEKVQEQVEKKKKEGEAFLAKQAKEPGYRTVDGVVFKVIEPGDGAHPNETSEAEISYEGKCDGVVFDQGEKVQLYLMEAIPGFSKGVQQVGKGGKVHFFVPSSLSYGDEGLAPIIPGGAVLEFTVTVHKFTSPAAPATTPPDSAVTPAPAM